MNNERNALYQRTHSLEQQADKLSRVLRDLYSEYSPIPAEQLQDELLAHVLMERRYENLEYEIRQVLQNNENSVKKGNLKADRVSKYLNHLNKEASSVKKELESARKRKFNDSIDSNANDLDRLLKEHFPQG